jgi:hypothetical protein
MLPSQFKDFVNANGTSSKNLPEQLTTNWQDEIIEQQLVLIIILL